VGALGWQIAASHAVNLIQDFIREGDNATHSRRKFNAGTTFCCRNHIVQHLASVHFHYKHALEFRSIITNEGSWERRHSNRSNESNLDTFCTGCAYCRERNTS